MTPPDPFFVGYFKKVPSTIRDFALGAGAVVLGGQDKIGARARTGPCPPTLPRALL